MFVLAKRRSGHFFTVRWRARGAVGFQGHGNVGTLFCPASPRPAVRPAPCRPDPPVVCPGFGLDRCRHFGLPSFAPPHRPLCAAPTRPARCVSGFWTRQVLDSTGISHAALLRVSSLALLLCPALLRLYFTCRIQNPDIPRAGRYGAAHGGTAGPGGDGQHRTPTTGLFAKEKTNSLTLRRWKNDLLGVPLEEGTREILCKPTEEQNPRLNRG